MIRIGLSCIVKNEANVIKKMLDSVVWLIDYWCIVDTGSEDGTQELIKKYFEEKGIEGELIQHTWKNFSDARNVAVEGLKGKTDWGFWIDADELVILKNKEFNKDSLVGYDGAYVNVSYGHLRYNRMQFFNLSSGWKWVGPVHEVLSSEKCKTMEVSNFYVLVGTGGSSWTSQTTEKKYENYIKLLKNYIDEHPKEENSRWVFYLAQSYRDTGSSKYYEDVIKWYGERLKMEGYYDEKYISQLNIARYKEKIETYSKDEILLDYMNCTNYNPGRIEHFEWIIEYYHSKKSWDLAYIFSSYAVKKNKNTSFLFLENNIYNWKIYDLHCLTCYYMGNRKEAKEYAMKLLDNISFVPQNHAKRIETNLLFYLRD